MARCLRSGMAPRRHWGWEAVGWGAREEVEGSLRALVLLLLLLRLLVVVYCLMWTVMTLLMSPSLPTVCSRPLLCV